MTDKEFKRLGRAQLIEVIYQLQLQIEKLDEEKQALENELNDKRIRLSEVGNIAEAALAINDCFRDAQNAAEQYLNEIKAIREEAEAQRKKTLEQAREEALKIISEAVGIKRDYDSAVENVLKEIGKNDSNNGR
jgi:hypothetical protein